MEEDEEIKKKRWAGATPCRALHGGSGCQSHEQGQVDKRKETREALCPKGLSPRPPDCAGISLLPAGALSPLQAHSPPALPTSSRGRCALQGEGPQGPFAHWKALSRCE